MYTISFRSCTIGDKMYDDLVAGFLTLVDLQWSVGR